MKCERFAGGFICGGRVKKSKTKTVVIPPPPVEVDRTYLVTGYHTGDFRGKCIAFRNNLANRVAHFRIVDPIKTGLQVDAEIEVTIGLARFLPTMYEQYQGGSKTLAVRTDA